MERVARTALTHLRGASMLTRIALLAYPRRFDIEVASCAYEHRVMRDSKS